MDKRYQGNKKKATKAAFLEREEKRQHKKFSKEQWDKAMEADNIGEAAKMLGIKL